MKAMLAWVAIAALVAGVYSAGWQMRGEQEALVVATARRELLECHMTLERAWAQARDVAAKGAQCREMLSRCWRD